MSINDLGTGYSSFSYIKWFPIDTMKIYQSFNEKLINYKGDLLIVKATITMSKTLNLEIIAEVVEHKKACRLFEKAKV
ncbi:EAL domain-containing protein [Peribacillus sp. FSL K6-1552]|uniref:EAL domain-containing protein n=1 Tax=Peribacillus sp. FSL K6-1552 TaxID=2954514 RepID=UPI0030F88E8D